MNEIRSRMDAMKPQDTRRIIQPSLIANVDARRGLCVWTPSPPIHTHLPLTDGRADSVWFDQIQSALTNARSEAPQAPPGMSYGEFVRQEATRIDTKELNLAHMKTELRHFKRQCTLLHVSLDLLSIRGKLLQIADDRPSAHLSHQSDQTNDAGSNIQESTPTCGFDERLCMDDELLAAWATSAHGRAVLNDEQPWNIEDSSAHICTVAQRDCKRHADWSAMRAAELDMLRDAQTAQLSALSERSHMLRITIERA